MPMQIQIAWRVNNAQLAPLFNWLNEFGYDWFNIEMSGVDSSRLGTFKSTMAIRLITNINIALMRVHRQNWYLVSSTAEYEPPLIDLTYVAPMFLSINPATHGHTADNLSLGLPIQTLSINQAFHAHNVDNLTLSTNQFDLSINQATHAHTADNLTIPMAVSLTIDDATHAHAADSLDLVFVTPLSINSADHAHSADNVTLSI